LENDGSPKGLCNKECWVCVIFFACVCVGTSDSTTASDDPSSSALCVVCTGHFPRGVPGGGGGGVGMPPLVTRNIQHRAVRPQIFFGAVFAIFSRFFYF
jgi:hypothetical protein